MLSNSTSNVKTAFGGITPGCPREPYAKSGEQTNRARSPTESYFYFNGKNIQLDSHFCNKIVFFLQTLATPSSHPRITSPRPMMNLNGLPRFRDESKTVPSTNVPV